MLRRIGRLIFKLIPLWSWRLFMYGTLGTLVLVGSLILGLRAWVLPNVESYRGDIEQALTRATGQRITIGEISADWREWRPQLALGKVTVHDRAGRPALELDRIDGSLSWLTLIVVEPRFHSLEIRQPHLAVRRAADGVISIGGIELGKGEGRGGLADWLLRQRQIDISEATISWLDEQRQAPELRLEQVRLKLQNDLLRHRFGLKAAAPADLAGLLDIRGDLLGGSVRNLHEWESQFFLQLDHADLAAWKPWIDLPIEIAQGQGALRAWIDVAQERLTGIVADVRLADVTARLPGALDPLELKAVSGRLGWRGWSGGWNIHARQLTATRADGYGFQPIEFDLRRSHAQQNKPSQGEIKASSLDLGALAQLAAHLPIDAAVREDLARYAPKGIVSGLSAKWSGDWPPARYDVKARFDQLGFNAVAALPGVDNLSGTIDATERRGNMALTKGDARLTLAKVFSQPLAFDAVTGKVDWTAAAGGQYDIRLHDVNFANADLAGSLHGTLQIRPEGQATVDLTAALTRADAPRVVRYMPLVVGQTTRDWVQQSVVAGQSNDVRLRLKGNLAEFPFADARKGVFEVTFKVNAGVLDYASGWPRIENIAAAVIFRGNRMEVRSSSAAIMGAQLSRVLAVIPDLQHAEETATISGQADGPTAEFLRFVAQSPVAAMIDRFNDGIEAQGRGRLGLQLTIPLRHSKDSRLAGSYEFFANRLRVDPDLPPLEQVDGRLEFTESSVSGQNISAQIFGGPGSISVMTQEGMVAVNASGRASVDALRKIADSPLLQSVSGSADWRGAVRVRAQMADLEIESNLQGIVSTLPAPFAKAASEQVAVRFERRLGGQDRDSVKLAWGSLLRANINRRRQGEQWLIDTAAIGLGTEAPQAEGPGVWIRGSLASLDLDRWRALLAQPGFAGAKPPPLAAVDLKFGTLDTFGRRFNDLSLSAREESGNWRTRVSARELAGEIGWRPQGKGAIVARLQRLALPSPLEGVDVQQQAKSEPVTEYPALDIVVDDFNYKDRALGRLEMVAVPDGRDWRIERLNLRNADASLTADGHWQWQALMPRTQMNLRLEVSDIGKFLVRMRYPQGVKGGTATLEGTLSWSGALQDLDLPDLSGRITVEAARGQFVKLDPGIGKLLSILSLQALPRRVALDFKDVFSEGFSFDSILGQVKIERGVATTDSFRISGSSAKVVMSGEIDLVHETQALRVRVTPSVGDSVSTVTALLGGPVAGIGVYLAQKLLNDPLGQLIAYDYSVTGTWSDPAVSKIAFDRPEPS